MLVLFFALTSKCKIINANLHVRVEGLLFWGKEKKPTKQERVKQKTSSG